MAALRRYTSDQFKTLSFQPNSRVIELTLIKGTPYFHLQHNYGLQFDTGRMPS